MTRPSRAAERGTTLMEVLISAGILLLVLTLALQFLVSANRYQKRASTAFELNQQALTGLTALSRELSHSNHASTLRDSNPPGVVFVGGDLSTAGTWQWDRVVCYYMDTLPNGTKALIRCMEAVTPQAAPPLLGVRNSAYFKNSTTIEHRVVARDLLNLDVQGADPYEVMLMTGREELGKQFSVKITVKVPLLN